MITWRSPTDFEDPDAAWANETKAYDEDTGTGSNNFVPPLSWGNYLILKRAAVNCRRVRFHALRVAGTITKINLDIYYDDAWHDLYEGDFTNNAWVEKTLASNKSLTQARVKFYNSHETDTKNAWLHEFDFGEIGDPDAPTDLEVEKQTNPDHVITRIPHFTAVFNANDTVKATHYQIEIGTTRLGSDKWDSGKQALAPECDDGNRCTLIPYGGSALPFNTKYWWRLKFWDTDGRATPWSDS